MAFYGYLHIYIRLVWFVFAGELEGGGWGERVPVSHIPDSKQANIPYPFKSTGNIPIIDFPLNIP